MSEQERQREARETLERVARETETLGASSLARAGRQVGDHFTGRDAVGADGAADPAELWGRRIGRGLSLVAFPILLYWLGAQLGWW